ncbi:MAG: T9SS type A sorting domain-containing protein, partial [Flavobacteriales bacterium]
PIEATIDFENSSRPWLQGIPDQEGFSELNWIRAGTQDAADEAPEEEVVFDDIKPGSPLDQEELYEGLLGGTWAPYCLVSYTDDVTFEGTTEAVSYPLIAPTTRPLYADISATYSGLNGLNNVDVVLTNKKELWTRVGVIEMQPNPQLAQDIDGDNSKDATKMLLRRHPSVDKNGLWNNTQPGYNQSEATLDGAQPIGMGWFPGYAIDVGTGERLNMAFGEDSWLGADNGKDMIWNPSSRLTSDLGGDVYAGGQHWIYVFKNSQREEANTDRMPAYDEGQYIYNGLEANFDNTTQQRRVFRATTWVGSAISNDDFPMLSAQEGLVPNECRIRLRINKPYDKYSPSQVDYENYDNSENLWNPLYTFSTKGARTITNDTETLKEALDVINIVPNPYYAYSEYEESKLDNRVRITNLPQECTITIYSVNGTLVRQFKKSDPLTFIDWDLKNQRNVPIAGGVYIVHIDVPGVGEKVLKWFGIMRPTDLDNF